jgi:uncharacterized protein (DUF934 family)
MAVINSQGQEIADPWFPLEADTKPTPNAILPLDALLASTEADLPRPLAVRVPSGTPPETLTPWLTALDLILVEFPKFRDGRGFSIARALREKYGFKGDIRATGHFLPDQFRFLQQCGFTSFEPPPEHPPEQWRRVLATTPANPHDQLLVRLVTPRV